ncbi:MAG: hypothetical protein PVJ47_04675 [Thiohalocapsa sp.]|jgi:hypothetical protein
MTPLHFRIALVALTLLAGTGPAPATEQVASAGAELSEAERQRELAKLMQIVAARQQPLQDADVTLRLNGNPQIGAADAVVPGLDPEALAERTRGHHNSDKTCKTSFSPWDGSGLPT